MPGIIRVHYEILRDEGEESGAGRSIASGFSVGIGYIDYNRFCRFAFETEHYTCSGGELGEGMSFERHKRQVERRNEWRKKKRGQDGHVGTRILRTRGQQGEAWERGRWSVSKGGGPTVQQVSELERY